MELCEKPHFFFALIDDSKLAFYNTVREDSS